MFGGLIRFVVIVIGLVSGLVTCQGPGPSEPPSETTTTTEPPVAVVTGTAYTFNTRDVIIGATVRVAEQPEISTTTAEDGSYRLEVPVGSTVTPVIEAEGHGSIRAQTFVLDDDHDGTSVDGVNLQTPTTLVYDGLRALITSFTGRDPLEDGCAVVSTIGDPRLAGMPFEEFIRFAPHGVAGATATIDPLVAEPIYFNSRVLPDPAQLTSSDDGGVLWPNVPPGTYTLRAEKEGLEFATARVTCTEAGQVINASPVRGLHAIPAGG